MNDREVAVTSVAAGVAWIVGLALIAVGIVGEDAWAGLGLWVTGVGGVLSIRAVVQRVVHARQEVFDMGRAYERGLASRTNGRIHSLH